MKFEGFEVRSEYAKKVIRNVPVIASTHVKGIKIGYGRSNEFQVRFSTDYKGQTVLWLPVDEDEIIFNVYDAELIPLCQKEFEMNPHNFSFFYFSKPKPINLKLDLNAITALFEWKKARIEPDKVKANFEFRNEDDVVSESDTYYVPPREILGNVVESFEELYERTTKFATVAVYYEGHVLSRVAPVATYNDRFVLFKAENCRPVQELPLAKICPPDHQYDILPLYDVYRDHELEDYYLATPEAYSLSALKLAAAWEAKTRRVTVRLNYDEFKAKVRVGKYGDVVLIPPTTKFPSYVIPTATARDTAKMLDEIVETKYVVLENESTTLTNDNCYYATIAEP